MKTIKIFMKMTVDNF